MLLLRAFFAFLLLPGIFAMLIPWGISTIDPWQGQGWNLGGWLLVVGLLLLLYCSRDFYVAGKGTLAPWSPPQNLVMVGLYRYSRNPMYIAVLFIISGWACIYGSPLTGLYLLFAASMFHLRVVYHEEVILSRQFSSQWVKYVENVPRWLV